ncbi:MAG: DNA-binding protein [Nanoarchaeota archaeon]|nr:DNA-binding protein [Nanoarchaeota archaeon]
MDYQNMPPEQMAQIEQMKKTLLRQALSKEALERLGRVRIANPNLAAQLELYLIQLYQAGQLKGVVDDGKLKQILDLLAKKREWKIRR